MKSIIPVVFLCLLTTVGFGQSGNVQKIVEVKTVRTNDRSVNSVGRSAVSSDTRVARTKNYEAKATMASDKKSKARTFATKEDGTVVTQRNTPE